MNRIWFFLLIPLLMKAIRIPRDPIVKMVLNRKPEQKIIRQDVWTIAIGFQMSALALQTIMINPEARNL